MLKTVTAAATGLLVALPVGPALAGGDDLEVRTAGQCTGGARWELKVAADDGGVEVEFEVDSNGVGQQWDYTLRGPGGVLSTGTRSTTGPSGSFSVEVRAPGAVTDTFRGTATFAGQDCDTSDGGPVAEDRRDDDSTHDRGRDDSGRRTDDRISGTCSDDSVARLIVRGRTATLRLDSTSRGERWRFTIRKGGAVVRTGTARTKGSKGVLRVKARSEDKGAFTARAERLGADGRCEIDD